MSKECNYLYVRKCFVIKSMLLTIDYCIALKFRGFKFLQIADFKLFAENFSGITSLRMISAKVTKFLLSKFRECLKIYNIHEI